MMSERPSMTSTASNLGYEPMLPSSLRIRPSSPGLGANLNKTLTEECKPVNDKDANRIKLAKILGKYSQFGKTWFHVKSELQKILKFHTVCNFRRMEGSSFRRNQPFWSNFKSVTNVKVLSANCSSSRRKTFVKWPIGEFEKGFRNPSFYVRQALWNVRTINASNPWITRGGLWKCANELFRRTRTDDTSIDECAHGSTCRDVLLVFWQTSAFGCSPRKR